MYLLVILKKTKTKKRKHLFSVFSFFADNVRIKSTLYQTKVVQKQQQQQQQQREETSQVETIRETETETEAVTVVAVAAVSGQQQLWQQKNVKTKMPVTTSTPQGKHELSIATTFIQTPTAASANILVKSPTSPSIREKAEKLLHSGGHYTPPPVILDGKRIKRKNEDLIGMFSKADVAADSNNISTSSSSMSSSTSSSSTSIIVQKQRSLYENSAAAAAYKTTKELIATTITTGKQEQLEMNKEEEIEVQETTTLTSRSRNRNRAPTSLNFDNTNGSGTQLDNSNSSCTATTATTSTTITTQTIRARSPLVAKQHQQQSHLKRDSEQTQETRSITIIKKSQISQQQQNEKELLALSSNNKSSSCGGETLNGSLTDAKKLFNSLQNNQFVKNQLQQQQVSPKKLNNNKKKQEISTATTTTSVTGSPTKLLYASAVVSTTTTTTTTTTAATASSDSVSVGVSVKNNNKMVAVQEMKKTTQNATHSHRCGSEQTQQQQQQQHNNNSSNYDSGEDLSYGPGIVEKLRVRYLSWAQRESMVEQQRRSLETLRRATSLSTLLDREQPLEEDDEEEEAVVTAKNNYNNKQQQQIITPVPAQRQSIKVMGGILKSGNNEATSKKTATFESNGNGNGNDNIRGSRALKRGNDSLKRARSVEALLSERVAWNFNPSANSSFTTNVTIEDKIINARERLVMGTDVMPPKRLSSIIDETERPPPDLVKQTLKKFEATANRRPRPTRANSKGEVASKVATYKSIINEQKPSILAKPTAAASPATPNSPTKRNSNKNGSVLYENTPDLIPRQKHLKLKSLELVDSPVTALTKRIEKLRLSTGSVEKTESTRCATNSANNHENAHDHAEEREQAQENENKLAENKQEVVGAETAQSSASASTLALAAVSYEPDIRKIDDEALNIVVDKHSQHDDDDDVEGEGEGDDNDDLEETAGIVSPSNSSVFSDDEDSLGLTKRVSRRALDNIARAGTSQQFIFGTQHIESAECLNNSSNNMRPLLNSAATNQVKQKSASYAAHLTSREIEKNRINELKKVTEASTSSSPSSSSSSSSSSSLNNVIQQKASTATTTTTKGQSELDASAIASGSPLWANMYKRRVAPPVAVTENTTMVFNFSNRKEVPDYIDNDIVLLRRKRELPKVSYTNSEREYV